LEKLYEGPDCEGDSRKLFVSWEPSNSRSSTLAQQFGADCYNIHNFALKRPWIAPLKYIVQSIRTWILLARCRPAMVFVQNPPPFAPLAVWIYCLLSGSKMIIDSHTGIFVERKWTALSSIHKFVARRALVNIVTNDYLGQILSEWGAKYFVFADVPTDFPAAEFIQSKPSCLVTVVNTFSFDEPLEEILLAAARLPQVEFRITGDLARCSARVKQMAAENTQFTGFVSREVYVNTLYSSDAAIVLTTEDHTMQRGAYEAMSMCVPVITSDWPVLRETFFRGAAFVDNSVDAIVLAVQDVLDRRAEFKKEISSLKSLRRVIWANKHQQFNSLYLAEPVSKGGSTSDAE
jgi:glycosyltransferase involved in cell wall biosynthesis